MTRLKLSSKNSAKTVLLNLGLILWFISGCSPSIEPTYLKENIDRAVEEICQKEYNLAVRAKLVGSTLWVYLPLENILTKVDKPERYLERFQIAESRSELVGDKEIKLDYSIRAVPEKEKFQEFKMDKNAQDKSNNVLKVIRRVIFSMKRSKDETKFFSVVTADIKNSFEIAQIFYYLDLKKVSYDYISWGEFQHRTLQNTNISPLIKYDRQGNHLNYKDIALKDFVVEQIQQRIRLKFSKPEVPSDTNIDKEIAKVVALTLKIYDFRELTKADLNNLLTGSRTILGESDIWNKAIER
jgi:hypothetical protein